MRRKVILVAVAAFLTHLVACDEDENNEENATPECSAEELDLQRCQENNVETCDGTNWVVETPCETGSETCVESGDGAICRESSPCGTTGDQRCFENDVETCDGSVWAFGEDCASSAGVCVESGSSAACEDTSCDPYLESGDACGGDIGGIWTMASICVNDEIEAMIAEYCPNAQIVDSANEMDGTMDFGGPGEGMFRRVIDLTATVTVEVPKTDMCAIIGCDALGSAVAGYLPGSSCTDGHEVCVCTAPVTTSVDETTPYTTDSGTLTTHGDRTWYYCVDGDQLSIQEYPGGSNESFVTQVFVR